MMNQIKSAEINQSKYKMRMEQNTLQNAECFVGNHKQTKHN